MYTKTKNALHGKWNWDIITPIPTGGAKMTEHVCEYEHCNGTYSTPRSLWTHYNKDHGLKKSNEEFQREINDTGVCNRKPIRKKSSQSQPKGRKEVLFLWQVG